MYPKPRTSPAAQDAKIYPYLLGAVAITRPNPVWSADITDVRRANGCMYLVAMLDWCSRYVLAWQLSTTLAAAFCLEALDMALVHGCPAMFTTDQGVQFTSLAFPSRLARVGSAIRLDGRGRALDNIVVERLWRTVKYEDIYRKDYGTVPGLEAGLERSCTFYNSERPHQSLAYRTPAEVHGEQERCGTQHPPYFCLLVVLTTGSTFARRVLDNAYQGYAPAPTLLYESP